MTTRTPGIVSRSPSAWVSLVACLLVSLLISGCFSEAPVRPDMFEAVAALDEYCDPLPRRGRPAPAVVRRAVKRIATVEKKHPGLEFRIEDSADSTTATDLLNDFARTKDCKLVIGSIAAARR